MLGSLGCDRLREEVALEGSVTGSISASRHCNTILSSNLSYLERVVQSQATSTLFSSRLSFTPTESSLLPSLGLATPTIVLTVYSPVVKTNKWRQLVSTTSCRLSTGTFSIPSSCLGSCSHSTGVYFVMSRLRGEQRCVRSGEARCVRVLGHLVLQPSE